MIKRNRIMSFLSLSDMNKLIEDLLIFIFHIFILIGIIGGWLYLYNMYFKT